MRNYQKIRNGYCYANKKSRLYDTMYVYIYIILYYTNMHSKYIVGMHCTHTYTTTDFI